MANTQTHESYESRTSLRKEVKVGVIYWMESKGERYKIDGASLTINMSGSGILLRMFHPVEMGASLHLKFILGKSVIQCLGRVARLEQVPGARAWSVAVQLDLQAADQEIVSQYLLNSSPK